jgi:hypothetical protein
MEVEYYIDTDSLSSTSFAMGLAEDLRKHEE